MGWLEVIAHGLVNPDIAYILLSLGTIALIAEFYNPGAVLPGVTGAICLILAFVALGSLPVNWGGVALIGLAFIFFILDLKVAGFALSIAGAISFILGSMFLFSPFTPSSPTMPRLAVSPWLLVLMTVLLVSFFSFALTAGLRAQRQKALISRQAVIGATGVALSDLVPQGVVQVQSEAWTATAAEPVQAGEPVEVISSDGLHLQVRRSS
jgi:membrane-bound serine protease (ClpP class)